MPVTGLRAGCAAAQVVQPQPQRRRRPGQGDQAVESADQVVGCGSGISGALTLEQLLAACSHSAEPASIPLALRGLMIDAFVLWLVMRRWPRRAPRQVIGVVRDDPGRLDTAGRLYPSRPTLAS
jgi:hypothetical protein